MPIKTVKRIPHVTRDKLAIVIVCLGMGTFGAGGTVAIDHIDKQSEESVKESTLEETCKTFGNSLRLGLREFFEDELERTEHPDPKVLEQFGLSIQQARELSAERIQQLKYDINIRFKDVPCGKVYK